MEMRLRQIALVARDLDAARADIASVFGLDYAYVDPTVGRYGLTNLVFPIGDTFLEVVSPVVEGTTAGRLLEKRGGDSGYMVILQTDRLAEARDRVRAAGARIVDQKDGDGVGFTHLHPRDVWRRDSFHRLYESARALGLGRTPLARTHQPRSRPVYKGRGASGGGVRQNGRPVGRSLGPPSGAGRGDLADRPS
jgi:catechol 2,3-dioxygenase-like lactoylglutathione lyase family enzyme